MKLWYEGGVYAGGDPYADRAVIRRPDIEDEWGITQQELTEAIDAQFNEHCEPAEHRLIVAAAVTPKPDGTER